MILKPASGTYEWRANSAGLYDDLDMCVTVTTLAAVEPMDAKAGLIFWYDDVNNFYVFEIAPNGRASVWRRQRGKWLAQVKWTDAASVNKDDGAINELRVTTVGSDATFYVNGTEFKRDLRLATGKGPGDRPVRRIARSGPGVVCLRGPARHQAVMRIDPVLGQGAGQG